MLLQRYLSIDYGAYVANTYKSRDPQVTAMSGAKKRRYKWERDMFVLFADWKSSSRLVSRQLMSMVIVRKRMMGHIAGDATPSVGPHKNSKSRFPETSMTKDSNYNENELFGITPLHLMASAGSLINVKELLSRHVNVNAVDHVGQTPLHYAAQYGHVEVVRKLLEAKAAVDAKDERKRTPLHLAAGAAESSYASHMTNKTLAEVGFDDGTIAKVNEGTHPPDSARAEVIRVLLAFRANPNEEYADGRTALMSATAQGYSEVVELLRSAGATK